MKKILVLVTTVFVLFAGGLYSEMKEKKVPDYSNVERSKIPVEYTWKIEDIYPTYDAWKIDKEKAAEMIKGIDKIAEGWTTSAKKFLSFLEYNSNLSMIGEKLAGYASHQNASDLSNIQFMKMRGDLQVMFVEYGSKVSFIQPDIIKLGKEKFEEYLKEEPKLGDYKVMVDKILFIKDHTLPADKEQIMAMTNLFSGNAADAAEMLTNVEIPTTTVKLSDGVEYTLNMQTYQRLRETKNPADRELNMLTFWANEKKYEKTLAILQDAEIKSHLFSSKVRGYSSCLEARLFPSKIDVSVYKSLIDTIRKNLSPLHRHMKLRKELLNLPVFKYPDIYASAVPKIDKEYSWEEAGKLVLESMKPLGKDYTDVIKKALTSRWIDIYPNKNKQTGAYSGGVYGIHPYVKMNYNGSYGAVSTLTHELGHSMHSYLSDQTQPYPMADYPIFLAEIASTFNENMLVDYFIKNEKDDLFKLYVIDSYLDQLRGTIYRQTLFAEFELTMHEYVEQGGTLTADWLNAKYLELTRLYYGHNEGVCQVDDFIQNEWSIVPHFYYNFYVYQYSTGIIASMALSDKVIKGEKGSTERYLSFLKSGGSKYPLETLKTAGIDLTTPSPYEQAIKRYDSLVTEMEKIAAKLKKEGKL
jgi:oligoendopeptidase F